MPAGRRELKANPNPLTIKNAICPGNARTSEIRPREGRDEGRDEGVIAARKQAILDILAERFGVVTPEVQSRIQSANDASRLQFAVRQSMRIASPGDLEI